LNGVALAGDAWLVEKRTRPIAKGMDRTRSVAPSVPSDVAIPATVPPILELQRGYGNAAVTRALLARCRDGSAEGRGGLAVLPGSPDARHAEDKQREQEAREEYERHLRETGEPPKEHQMRRAADKQFAAQEDAEAAQSIGEALERIEQRERHARDIVAAHKLALQGRQERWRQAWSQEEVKGSLEGVLKPARQSDGELQLRSKANDAQIAIRKLEGKNKGPKPSEADAKPGKAEVQPADADATRLAAAKKRLQEANEALEQRRGEFEVYREFQERNETALIDAVVNPDVSAHALSQAVDRFLRSITSGNVNLTKKLSELVTAKAVWFSGSDPVELAPGPKAVGTANSPDYVSGENVIGDNFRVEGVAPALGEIVLQPDPSAHARPMQNVLNAITKGIKSKVTTYFLSHVRHGKRVVVTVDVSDCPWVLQPAHLSAISAVAHENAGVIAKEKTAGTMMSVAGCLHAVYFVVDGRAYRVFPGWRSPAGFDPPTQRASDDLSPSVAAPVDSATRSKAAKVNVKGPSKAAPLTLGEDLQKLVDRTTELLAGNPSALEELAHVRALFEQRRMAPRNEPVESGSRRVLGGVLTKLNTFLEKHGKRVRGDFVKRIWRSLIAGGDMREAEGELEAATAILEGRTPLGTVQSVEALPESTEPGVETPEFRVVLESGATALVEVKTIGGPTQSAVKKNLNKAISQIRFQSETDAASSEKPSAAPSSSNDNAPKTASPTPGGAAGGMIRIDATAGKPSTREPSEQADEIHRWIKGELTQLRGEVNRQRRATDFVRFVEVLFTRAQGTVTVVFECHGEVVTRRSISVTGGGGQGGPAPAPAPSKSGEKGLDD
jgi:hypothetical protein